MRIDEDGITWYNKYDLEIEKSVKHWNKYKGKIHLPKTFFDKEDSH